MNCVTVNISGKESADLVCPYCKKLSTIAVSNLSHRIYRAKCKCTNSFLVEFDRREFIRRLTNFIGTYAQMQSFTNNIINISNVSRGGLGFSRTDRGNIRINDKIIINFNLDNSEHDLIEGAGLVRNICDEQVCVEFVHLRGWMRTILGFYCRSDLEALFQNDANHAD